MEKKHNKHSKKKGGWQKMKNLSKKTLEVFKAKAGNISATCEAVGITRKTFYEWLEKSPEFKQRVEEIQESLIDFAESMLLKNIREGKETSIFFFLVNRKPEKWKSITKVQMEHSGSIKTGTIDILNQTDLKTGRKIGEIVLESLKNKK